MPASKSVENKKSNRIIKSGIELGIVIAVDTLLKIDDGNKRAAVVHVLNRIMESESLDQLIESMDWAVSEIET